MKVFFEKHLNYSDLGRLVHNWSSKFNSNVMKGLKAPPKGVKGLLFYFILPVQTKSWLRIKRACLATLKSSHSNSWHDKWEEWWNKVTKIDEVNGNSPETTTTLPFFGQNNSKFSPSLYCWRTNCTEMIPKVKKCGLMLICTQTVCLFSCSVSVLRFRSLLAITNIRSLKHLTKLLVYTTITPCVRAWMWWMYIYLGCIYLSVWTPLLFILAWVGATMFIQRLYAFFWWWGHKSDSLVAQQHLSVLKCAI